MNVGQVGLSLGQEEGTRGFIDCAGTRDRALWNTNFVQRLLQRYGKRWGVPYVCGGRYCGRFCVYAIFTSGVGTNVATHQHGHWDQHCGELGHHGAHVSYNGPRNGYCYGVTWYCQCAIAGSPFVPGFVIRVCRRVMFCVF